MKTVTVIFDEPLHHVCLMHGLKQTYGRMPFLNKRVLEIRGKYDEEPKQTDKFERNEEYGRCLILEEQTFD